MNSAHIKETLEAHDDRAINQMITEQEAIRNKYPETVEFIAILQGIIEERQELVDQILSDAQERLDDFVGVHRIPKNK